MRSKLEHVENVANQASSVMLKCMHSLHTLITHAADYKCQPFQAEQDHEKTPVYLACLHLWSRINSIKKLLCETWLLYGCMQVRGCNKGDAQCTSTELIDFSNKCSYAYTRSLWYIQGFALLATFLGGFASIRTALWLWTYSEVGMWCSICM
jgi:hypothetical protein